MSLLQSKIRPSSSSQHKVKVSSHHRVDSGKLRFNIPHRRRWWWWGAFVLQVQ